MDEESPPDRNRYSHPRNDFLKKTSCKRGGAGQQRATVSSTGRGRELIASEKVVYAKNKGSSPLEVWLGVAPGPDRPQWLDRPGDRSSVLRNASGRKTEWAIVRTLRCPA